MKSSLHPLLGAVVLLALVGCQRASSPDSVERNVDNARHAAAQDDVKALREQARTDAAANNDAASALQKAEVKKSDSAYDVAVTEAEGRHKIELQRCDALAGDAQRACKDQADATLSLAKANAQANKVAAGGG